MMTIDDKESFDALARRVANEIIAEFRAGVGELQAEGVDNEAIMAKFDQAIDLYVKAVRLAIVDRVRQRSTLTDDEIDPAINKYLRLFGRLMNEGLAEIRRGLSDPTAPSTSAH